VRVLVRRTETPPLYRLHFLMDGQQGKLHEFGMKTKEYAVEAEQLGGHNLREVEMGGSTGPLIGVIVGAAVTIVVTLISVWKDHLQSQRTQRADKERWLRDKLHEIYSNCIYYSNNTPGPTSHGWIGPFARQGKEFEFGELSIELDKLNNNYHRERLKWFNLLAIHHPFRGKPEYETFIHKMQNNEIKIEDIVSLASCDPRLKTDYTAK